MSRSPIFVQSLPRLHRALLRFTGLFAVLLCAAACRPPAAPRTNPPALEKNPPALEKEIRGGEVHTYPIELQAGQFVRVIAEENGVDLSLRLLEPEGTLVTGVDPPETDTPKTEYADVAEDLAAVAAIPGPHRLEVTAGKGSGRYLLRVEGPRSPSPEDRVRTEAVRATWDALTPKVTKEARIGLLERALTLWRRTADGEKSAEILFRLGLLRYKLKVWEQALASFRQAAEGWALQPSNRSRVSRAESLTHVGRCLYFLGRSEEARAAHDQALALARNLGETGLQAENLNLLARLADDEGAIQKALDLRHQALEKARGVRDALLEARILSNLGRNYQQLGEMQKALEFLEEALRLARSASSRGDEIRFLTNLGALYRSLGNWDKAFENYQSALEMIGATGDAHVTGSILINLAEVYHHWGQLEKVRDALDRALVLGRQNNNREIQVYSLGHLAFLVLQSGRVDQAAEHAREAVGLARTLEEEAFSRYALGSILQRLGETASARTELTKALAVASRRGNHVREAEIHLALAGVYRETGDLDAALSGLRAVSELIELWRGRMIDPGVKTAFLASAQDFFEFQVNTLMALHAQRPGEGFAAEALRVSEQARARSLLEILSEARAGIDQGAEPAALQKERESRQELSDRDWNLHVLLAEVSPNAEKVAEAERRRDEALEAYRRAQVEVRKSSPRYAALTQPQPLSLEEIRREVLGSEALLLEYSLGAKESFLWAVTSDSFDSFTLAGRDQIEEKARRYYEQITARNEYPPKESVQERRKRIAAADAEAEQVARDLSRMILQPVEPLLGDRPLLIVADGALQYVPFAALPLSSTGASLVSGHEVVNLPSASVLAVLRRELRGRQPAPRALAIFADPVFEQDDERLSRHPSRAGPRMPAPVPSDEEKRGGQPGEPILDLSDLPRLRASGREADAIAALLPPEEVSKSVGCAASRAAVTDGGLDLFRTVHFATHGFIQSDSPELSRLVMSLYSEDGQRQDGFLRLSDIYGLRLSADLVVLSACRTALGKEIRGEGLVGLTRGFMYAGAARVLATLWSVQDRATAELMTAFYRGMLRDGLSPAAALRQAQLEMTRKTSWSSPFYWAGFSLQGEWR